MALKTNAKNYAAFNVYCQAGFTTIMPRNVKQSKDYLNNSMVVKPHFKNFTIFFMVFTIPFLFFADYAYTWSAFSLYNKIC